MLQVSFYNFQELINLEVMNKLLQKNISSHRRWYVLNNNFDLRRIGEYLQKFLKKI